MTCDPLDEDDGAYAMGGSSWLRNELLREEQREFGTEVSGRGHAKLLLDTRQITKAQYDDLMHQYDELEEQEPWRRR